MIDPHGSWEDHGGWGWEERWNQALENEIKDRKLGRHLSWVGTNWKWDGCWWWGGKIIQENAVTSRAGIRVRQVKQHLL